MYTNEYNVTHLGIKDTLHKYSFYFAKVILFFWKFELINNSSPF